VTLEEVRPGYVEDVVWCGCRKLWCQRWEDEGRRTLRGIYVNGDRFNCLSTASARHAGRRAAVVITRWLFVARAWFAHGHGRDAGQAERQQPTENEEREANHGRIVHGLVARYAVRDFV